jgi:polyisoprenoid-binding protein YceI
MLTLLAILTLALSACGLLREPEEASGPLEAVPVTVEEPATTETVTEEVTAAETAQLRIFQIDQGASEVRFELDEDLRGQRVTVVGSTNQVAGELAFNLADLSTAQVGLIQVNARGLLTDNNFRNRAIHNEILDTGQYELITFAPTAIEGLPATAAVGDEISFNINGNLTIRDITQPVTFQVTALVQSENGLVGTAGTTIEREAFGLNIPSVPQVANVEPQVELYIDFVANAA